MCKKCFASTSVEPHHSRTRQIIFHHSANLRNTKLFCAFSSIDPKQAEADVWADKFVALGTIATKMSGKTHFSLSQVKLFSSKTFD